MAYCCRDLAEFLGETFDRRHLLVVVENDPLVKLLKLRTFGSPLRKRGNTVLDFASLTLRATKNTSETSKAQLQNVELACLNELERQSNPTV